MEEKYNDYKNKIRISELKELLVSLRHDIFTESYTTLEQHIKANLSLVLYLLPVLLISAAEQQNLKALYTLLVPSSQLIHSGKLTDFIDETTHSSLAWESAFEAIIEYFPKDKLPQIFEILAKHLGIKHIVFLRQGLILALAYANPEKPFSLEHVKDDLGIHLTSLIEILTIVNLTPREVYTAFEFAGFEKKDIPLFIDLLRKHGKEEYMNYFYKK